MRKVVVLIMTFLAFTVYTMNFTNYAPLAPSIVKTMNLSYTQSGLIISFASLIHAAFMIPMGALSDRWGGNRVLVFGLAIMGVSVMVFPLSPNYGIILLSRVALGIGSASVITSCVKLISSAFSSKEQDKAIGIWGTGWGVGFMVTFLLIPQVEDTFGWEWGFYFFGAATLLLFAASMAVLKGTTPRKQHTRKKSVDLIKLFGGNFLPVVGVRFTAIYVAVGTMTWIPFYLKDVLHASTMEVGYVGGLLGIVTIPASIAGGIVSNMWRRKPVIFISMVMCSVGSVAFVYSPTLGIAVLSAAVLGWATMFWAAPTVALINSEAGESVGFRYGLFNSIGFTGSFIAPLIMGYTLDTSGSFEMAFIVLGVGAAALGVTGAILIKEKLSGQ